VLGLGRGHYTPAQIRVWAAAGHFEYQKSKGRKEIFFVAAQSSRIIGFSSVLEDEIHELYVAASFAGRGIGARLLEAGEKELAKQGYRKIRLVSSLNALPFYISMGWKRGPSIKRRLEDQVFSVVKMAKKL
jgi:ribosomal protein S18 acetylase RimI-like enzyme